MGRNNHISDLFFIKQSSASVLEEKFIKFKAQGENCHSKWKRDCKELLANFTNVSEKKKKKDILKSFPGSLGEFGAHRVMGMFGIQ